MKNLGKILIALCLVLSLAACSSTSTTTTTEPTTTDEKTYTVGIIQLMQHNALDAATQGFEDALTEKLGDSVEFDYQNAAGDSAQASTIATGFVANEYDLIMANATPCVTAALSATSTIPVVGTSVTDYATALGTELNADGTSGINLTGTSDGVDAQLYVNCLLELVPEAKNVSVLYCSAEANSVVQVESFKAAMAETNPDVTVTEYTFADSNEMQAVVNNAIIDCDAIYIPTDNTAASNMTIVSNACVAAKIPVICGEENMTKAGGTATVSISYYEIGYQAGLMAYEILANGADPATMPFEYAESLVGEYNAANAEAIGLTVPDTYTALSED